MNEIYWITRLDMVNGWLLAFAVISGIVMAISIIVVSINNGIIATSNWDNDIREAKGLNITFKPILKNSAITFCIALPLCVLTPTKNEALLIYGVGTTVDYLQSNEIVNQLPDKCVKALDTWVDSLVGEEYKD